MSTGGIITLITFIAVVVGFAYLTISEIREKKRLESKRKHAPHSPQSSNRKSEQIQKGGHNAGFH